MHAHFLSYWLVLTISIEKDARLIKYAVEFNGPLQKFNILQL
jgi:hypothetical protein